MATVFKRNGKGPWIIQFFDHSGRRREKSSRTTDKRAADRIAAQIESGTALRREGVIDPRADRYAVENTRGLQEHVDAYVKHLENGRRSPLTIRDARAHLKWITANTGATRLSDLTLDAIERVTSLMQSAGRSARTVNARGGAVVAFLNWCVKSGRIDANPLRFLSKSCEATDRRRTRRALTEEEITKLLAVAEARGRKLWYLLALWAGLRRSELSTLTWGDFDQERGVVVIRKGKAKRVDEVPLHPDLAVELARVRPTTVLPTARVFAAVVTNRTRQLDFARAGIAITDAMGRHADLHALRTTLGTMLARGGVAPQVAQRIMRHDDYRTTLKHYTRLEREDLAAAVNALPRSTSAPADPQQYPQQSQHGTARSDAM